MAAVVSAPPVARAVHSSKTESFTDTKRRDDVRHANIAAARAVADAVRTSLGPRGMDKMIITPSSNEVCSISFEFFDEGFC